MSDDAAYREQIAYLLERSPFYREKLAGHDRRRPRGHRRASRSPTRARSGRRSRRENPIGAHLCAEPHEIVRIYSTSGTTGTPSYIPLTAQDLDNWVTGSARSYAASGIEKGQRIVSTYNAGPFVAGAALAAFDRLGLTHIPVGTGNTDRLIKAVELLRPEAVVMTPSYAAYLWSATSTARASSASSSRASPAAASRSSAPSSRPAGARASPRRWGSATSASSLWGECEQQDGMHLGAHGFVHPELIDPETGEAVPMEDGATGELVLTHLRHRAAPLLRFRTRDHVVVRTTPVPVRPQRAAHPLPRPHRRHADRPRRQRLPLRRPRGGVSGFAPEVSGHILVRPQAAGVKQEPPLPVSVELAQDARADAALAESIRERLRSVLVVQTRVELVPWGTLQRSEYKSKLVER